MSVFHSVPGVPRGKMERPGNWPILAFARMDILYLFNMTPLISPAARKYYFPKHII